MGNIGGWPVGWSETNPDNTRNAGLGAQDIRSLTSNIRGGLDAEHNWPAAGGTKVGYHLFGSARPFFGAQSLVSSTGTDGRLFQASDTSRLFHLASGGTCLVGAGPNSLSLATSPGSFPQRHYWVEEVGVHAHAGGSDTINFPNSGFSGVPYVFLSTWSFEASFAFAASLMAVTPTSFQFQTSKCTLVWRSLGTRVL